MKHLKKFNESVNTEYVVKSKVNLYRGEKPTEFTDKYKTKARAYNKFIDSKNHPNEVETKVLFNGVDVTKDFETEAIKLGHDSNWGKGLDLEISPEIQKELDRQKELDKKYSGLSGKDKIERYLRDLGGNDDDIGFIKNMFPEVW